MTQRTLDRLPQNEYDQDIYAGGTKIENRKILADESKKFDYLISLNKKRGQKSRSSSSKASIRQPSYYSKIREEFSRRLRELESQPHLSFDASRYFSEAIESSNKVLLASSYSGEIVEVTEESVVIQFIVGNDVAIKTYDKKQFKNPNLINVRDQITANIQFVCTGRRKHRKLTLDELKDLESLD